MPDTESVACCSLVSAGGTQQQTTGWINGPRWQNGKSWLWKARGNGGSVCGEGREFCCFLGRTRPQCRDGRETFCRGHLLQCHAKGGIVSGDFP